MNELTTFENFNQALLASEQRQLAKWLPAIFGYYLLALSDHLTPEDLNSSKIHKRFVAKPQPGQAIQLTAKPTELPFADNSIDCLILHHQLETLNNPAEALAEAERVLISHGQLIIIGFNPNSLLSLGQRFTKTQYLRPKYPYSLPAVTALLADNQLVLEESVCFFYKLPWHTRMVLETFCAKLWPGSGAVYALRIRKKKPCLIPLPTPCHSLLQASNAAANQ